MAKGKKLFGGEDQLRKLPAGETHLDEMSGTEVVVILEIGVLMTGTEEDLHSE